MTIRFFILQAHYRSTVDFSNEALQASEKGLARLFEAYHRLQKIQASSGSSVSFDGLREKCHEAMSDDLNTPIVISHLFEACKNINLISDGKATISQADLKELKEVFSLFLFEILGLSDAQSSTGTTEAGFTGAIDLLMKLRMEAKQNKDWNTSDRIRNELTALGFEIKDTKDGYEWKIAK
jgi:cysteinyl-tRNA synthetase